jgi:integrase
MTEPVRRQRRPQLTDKQVAELPKRPHSKSEPKPYFFPDPQLPKHGVRVRPNGPSTYTVITRDPYKKQRWIKIGSAAGMKIEEAREIARAVIRRVEQGLDPFEPPPVRPDTVADVCAGWLVRHVEARGLRTGNEMQRILERYVLPGWRDRPFADIRRSDIARLLDIVEDAHGRWVADSVLSVLRSVSSWFAARNDSYVPPFVKNMKRVPAHARKRSRMLDDNELKRLWRTAEASEGGTFGAFIRVLLLSAQRREKVATMRWADLDGRVWRIPSEAREKGNAEVLRLPPQAMAIITAQPRIAGSAYVFTGRGGVPISGFSRRKAEFDKRCDVKGYSLHDLRRCARSLLSRASVQPHIAERVLGHTIGGIEGIYDRHLFTDEKANALERLANLIESIVSDTPSGTNVLPMHPPAAVS